MKKVYFALFIIFAIFCLWVYSFFRVMTEIEQKGLKNIGTEIWEGTNNK